jgi:O-antigen/teichoic acid export membrane protein
LALYSVLATTTASVPKLVLERVLGNDALGVYGPVTQPVLLLQVGATYLFNPFITVFANAYVQRDRKRFYKALAAVQGIVFALLPLGLLVAHFLGRWGLATFVSPELADYQYLLAPMVVSAVLTALMLFYSMVLTVMRCMRGLIIANACGIVAAAMLSEPCIRRWELQGTTYAAIGALLVQCICLLATMWWKAQRHFHQPEGIPVLDE